ncbi:YadA-like family protein [Haemophilus haemolyticus]|uniref:YadA-like family protein n=1 Tax=Haemophilus haemolyticus TaxID=726 RepID=UPI000E56B84A|nr:YadA-like family protein [Haemophilus haemolyticus]
MNTIFKVIWNKSMQRQEVVSELARGAAKSSSTSRTNKIAKTHCVSILATVITSILAGNIAYAASNSNETYDKGFVHVNASGTSDSSAENFGKFTEKAGATGANAITVGVKANAVTKDSIAIGTESKVKKTANQSLALGYKATAGQDGNNKEASSNKTIAIGSEAEAIRDSAIAIGDKASAANLNAISIGKNIQNGSIGATAIGGGADIGGFSENSIAIGTGATVGVEYSNDKKIRKSDLHHERAIAIGYNAKSKNSGDISIGHNSESSKLHETSNIQIGNESYTLKDSVKPKETININNKNIAIGTVSFGNDNIKRQVQNVAAGSISETSTDAINGAQLYNVIKATNEIANTEYTFKVNNIDAKTMGNKNKSATNNASNTLNFAADEGLEVAYKNDAITYKLKDELKQSIENAAQKTYVDTSVNAVRDELKQSIAEAPNKSYVDNSVNSVRTATDEIAKTEYKFKVNGKDAKTMTNNSQSAQNNTNNTLNFNADEGLEVSYNNGNIAYKLKDKLKQSIDNAANKTYVDNSVNSVRNELKQSIADAPNKSYVDNSINSVRNEFRQSIANAPNKSYVDNSVNSVRRELQQTDKKLRGGIAGAVAMANIPTANRAGGTMVGVGVGNFKGRSAVAVGINRASDTNRTHFKMSGSATTSGDYAVGAGMGYQW